MTADRFLPGGQSASQQQPSPPPAHHGRKGPRETTKSIERPSDAPFGSLPPPSNVPLVIREPPLGLRPTEMIGSNVASSSAPPASG